MGKRIILGVQVDHRVEEVPHVQSVFTEFGCYIKTRIGLHEVLDGACSPSGLIILETYGDLAEIAKLESTLTGIPGVVVKRMEFDV